MKIKILVLFLIFLLCSHIECLAAPAKWARPQYIKTYIPPKHKHAKLMKKAFEKWSTASGNKIKFYYVHTPKIAQIRVEFFEVNPYNEWDVSYQEGYTRRNKKLRSHIYISTRKYTGENLTQDEIYRAMLHEIGHCIGLPHTRNHLSVMYPSANIKQDIMQTDIDKLKMLYNIKTR